MKLIVASVVVGALLVPFPGAGSDTQTSQDPQPREMTQEAARRDRPAEASQPGAEQEGAEPAAVEMPAYALPKVGKPRRRVGGGRRGPADEVPSLMALAPAHVGLTTEAGPTIAWYVSDEVGGDLHFQIVLIDQTSIDPLIDDRLPTPERAGIQQVRLADYGAQLEVGQEYEWSVELVVDEQHRVRDVVATGWVERVETPEGLEMRLVEAGPGGRAAVLASEGLWYDALAETLDLASRADEDPRYVAPLTALLNGAEIQLPPTEPGAAE